MRVTSIRCAAVALLAGLLAAQDAPERDAAGSQPVIEEWRTLSAHSQRVRCLQFAPDGRLASGGADRLLNLLTAKGDLLRSIDLRPGGG